MTNVRNEILEKNSIFCSFLDESDFWPMLNILTEYINKNIDYYKSEPAGADFIMHLRAEIERTKSRPNETWFICDQHLAILTFYLKYALSGTAIPRNLMINADAVIAQANLKDTGTLLAGKVRISSLVMVTFKNKLYRVYL